MSGKTAAERLREKAERLARQQADSARPQPAPEQSTDQAAAPSPDVPAEPRRVPAAAPVRAKPIRSTIDLPPARHHALKAWCDETAVQLGRSRVTTQEIVSAMVHRLLTDETFARKMRADLRDAAQ